MKNRWINFLFFFLIILVSALSYHLLFREQTREAARLLINILRPLSHLLVSLVLFILLRSLVKLYFARRRQVKGYRLQTKVILSLLPLSILPSVALFLIATRYLDDFLLNVSLEVDESQVITYADDIIQDHYEIINRHMRNHGEVILDLWRQDRRQEVVAYLDKWEIDAVAVRDSNGGEQNFFSNNAPFDAVEAGLNLPDLFSNDSTLFPDGLLLRRHLYSEPDAELLLIESLETEFSERFLYIQDSARFLDYNYKKTSQLRGLNRTILLITTLTILFGGVWTALTLSRRFLDAFNVLIQGAEMVSKGDLDTRLQLTTGDEMEDVLDHFNNMTHQLKVNRTELEQKAADLSQVNSELTEQIQYNQAVVQQTNAGILSTDRNHRLRTFNTAAAGILETELVPDQDFVGQLDGHRHGALLKQWESFRQDPSRTGFSQLEVLDQQGGGGRNVAVTIVALAADGDNHGTLILLEDLTELMNAQKLAAWREVARRVAHEIKNPLTPIQLSIQRIQRKAEKGAPDLVTAVNSAYETIMSETNLLKNLVNEFSTFAKLPAPMPEPTDLKALLLGIHETYRDVHPKLDFQIDLPEAPVHWKLDPNQFRQVLGNLINNAAEAMGGEGHLMLRMNTDDRGLRLSVVDSGPGVPREMRDKIFLPYYSKSPKGTGLGLAIVKRIIEDHDGKISVEDQNQGGAVFMIDLPATGRISR